MQHPLRLIVPPLIVLAAIALVYVPMRRHAIAQRERPHDNPHKPVPHATVAGVVAAGLIAAFVAAFILP
jgi:hypothetical protein